MLPGMSLFRAGLQLFPAVNRLFTLLRGVIIQRWLKTMLRDNNHIPVVRLLNQLLQ